jgi:hypothetical protein
LTPYMHDGMSVITGDILLLSEVSFSGIHILK